MAKDVTYSSSSRADVVSHTAVESVRNVEWQHQSRRDVGLRTEYHSRRERSQCRIAAESVDNVQQPFKKKIPTWRLLGIIKYKLR